MYNSRITNIVASLVLVLTPALAKAQGDSHPHLHVDPRWRECSFKLDPSLSRDAWRQFAEEAGLVTYFRSLGDARPMGRGKVELSLLQWETAIDDHDSAWNDTFVHPDSTHYLIEGSGLRFPGLMARVGISKRVDVGAYFTKNPRANYGFYGGQVQYNFLNDETRNWAVATRLSFVSLYGPEDLDFSVIGWDALASRSYQPTSWVEISPYVGISSYLSRAHEKSAVVDLADAYMGGSQAMAGVSVQLSVLRVSAEVNSARVRSRSLKIGVGF